jgi:hypothetical protein
MSEEYLLKGDIADVRKRIRERVDALRGHL